MKSYFAAAVAAATLFTESTALIKRSNGYSNPKNVIKPRQLPAFPTGVQTIITPNGINITYKEPGKEGVCETTPGVNSYSGFVNIAPDVHSFFWFFEAREDPANAPITLWLNGGPGSDSMIGLLQEHGPCNITEDLMTAINPYSWNNVSNMIYLSQPIGVGFSYGSEEPGSLDDYYGVYQTSPVDGRYPVINATAIDTTDLAAVAAWEVIQGFYSALPQLDSTVKSKVFNLATESYGGHYGPAFFEYFYEQNLLISNGTQNGTQIEMNSLTIINGIIDEYIQAPYYPEFANHNTYNITAVNETVYNYMKFAAYMTGGCLDQISACVGGNLSLLAGQAVCAEAADMCRDNVESPYYYYGGRGVYDIRDPFDDPVGNGSLIPLYLNQPSVQEALGVATNYTQFSNNDIYYAFQQTGDFVYLNFIEDLEMILNNSIRVSLIYGDADYICNWFGGEAVSLQAQWTGSEGFNAAGYTPMVVDGVEYGETREYGLFSFTRVYEAGHQVPLYQPVAALQLFNRTIFGYDTATGTSLATNTTETTGEASATHTESFVPLPTTSSSVASASATSIGRIPKKPRKPIRRM